MLKLHADVALEDFEMRLAGTSRPFVAARCARLAGAGAVARQATAPPQTLPRRLPVGAHRSVSIPVTVKGCRPTFKFYTDLQLEADALAVCHSQVCARAYGVLCGYMVPPACITSPARLETAPEPARHSAPLSGTPLLLPLLALAPCSPACCPTLSCTSLSVLLTFQTGPGASAGAGEPGWQAAEPRRP